MAKALKAGQFSLKTYAGLEMDLLQKSFVKEEMYAEMIAENLSLIHIYGTRGFIEERGLFQFILQTE